MEASKLMSGIAVVIDDAICSVPDDPDDSNYSNDRILSIVNWFEKEWQMSFVKQKKLPSPVLWPNLLKAASFVLLDWRLWGQVNEKNKPQIINDIKNFLKFARENLVPVFILTNEEPEDVKYELDDLADEVYDGIPDESSVNSKFIFIVRKLNFWSGNSVNVKDFETWIYGNASIYTLKTWDRVLENAKSDLFKAMCRRNVDWPRVFWKAYEADGAKPSAELTNMINDSLRGRIRVNEFESEHLESQSEEVSAEELRQLIVETSFINNNLLQADEVRCGDLFKGESARDFWLNLRADCDCIPRKNDETVDEIEIYCIYGKKLSEGQESKKFKHDKCKVKGNFLENINEGIVFGVIEVTEKNETKRKSIRLDFNKLRVCKYSELRDKREGRLLHPYITRIQQRYALYLQRQALPPIPGAAVKENDQSKNCCCNDEC